MEWGLPERLDTLPEGEVTAGGVREMLGVPGPAGQVAAMPAWARADSMVRASTNQGPTNGR
jgi:hypothetical protein